MPPPPLRARWAAAFVAVCVMKIQRGRSACAARRRAEGASHVPPSSPSFRRDEIQDAFRRFRQFQTPRARRSVTLTLSHAARMVIWFAAPRHVNPKTPANRTEAPQRAEEVSMGRGL